MQDYSKMKRRRLARFEKMLEKKNRYIIIKLTTNQTYYHESSVGAAANVVKMINRTKDTCLLLHGKKGLTVMVCSCNECDRKSKNPAWLTMLLTKAVRHNYSQG